jgi:hypothetical protein
MAFVKRDLKENVKVLQGRNLNPVSPPSLQT